MTKLKLLWPVNITGDGPKIILSPDIFLFVIMVPHFFSKISILATQIIYTIIYMAKFFNKLCGIFCTATWFIGYCLQHLVGGNWMIVIIMEIRDLTWQGRCWLFSSGGKYMYMCMYIVGTIIVKQWVQYRFQWNWNSFHVVFILLCAFYFTKP